MSRAQTTFSLIAAAALGGLACASLSSAAQADDPPAAMDKAFGSTIVSTYPDGRQAELWLKKDGSYTAEGRRRDPSKGKWDIKDGKLCLHPSSVPFSWCTGMPAGGLEKPWSAKAATGEPITIKLVKGMHGRSAAPSKKSENSTAQNDG